MKNGTDHSNQKHSCHLQVVALNDFIEILGGKWRFPIIFLLYYSPLKFSGLKRELVPITSRALTQNLEDLLMNHLILKDEQRGVYTLSEHASGLGEMIREVREYHDLRCEYDSYDADHVQTMNDAMKEVFSDLAGKWRMIIMSTLFHYDISRFNEIQASIPSISSKELSRNLTALVENGIVVRFVQETDLRERYALSEKGKRFENIMKAMVNWALEHREFLRVQ